MTTEARAALARRREQGAGVTGSLGEQISRMKDQFQMAMPRGVEATQLVRDALTALRGNPQLAQCESTSVLGSLMTCAQLGLRPGVLGHAYLVPFKGKATLVIGYQGMIELAHRSGQIKSLIARTVYSADTFRVAYGLDDALIHEPRLDGDRGEPVAYYAVAKFTSGGHAFVVMTAEDVRKHRARHALSQGGPWRDHFEAMAHKTCVRQLAKYLPQSTDLAHAIAADDGVRVDLTPNVDPAEATSPVDIVDGEVVNDPPADEPAAQPSDDQAGTP